MSSLHLVEAESQMEPGKKNRPAGVERALGEIGPRGEGPMSGQINQSEIAKSTLGSQLNDDVLLVKRKPTIDAIILSVL